MDANVAASLRRGTVGDSSNAGRVGDNAGDTRDPNAARMEAGPMGDGGTPDNANAAAGGERATADPPPAAANVAEWGWGGGMAALGSTEQLPDRCAKGAADPAVADSVSDGMSAEPARPLPATTIAGPAGPGDAVAKNPDAMDVLRSRDGESSTERPASIDTGDGRSGGSSRSSARRCDGTKMPMSLRSDADNEHSRDQSPNAAT